MVNKIKKFCRLIYGDSFPNQKKKKPKENLINLKKEFIN